MAVDPIGSKPKTSSASDRARGNVKRPAPKPKTIPTKPSAKPTAPKAPSAPSAPSAPAPPRGDGKRDKRKDPREGMREYMEAQREAAQEAERIKALRQKAELERQKALGVAGLPSGVPPAGIGGGSPYDVTRPDARAQLGQRPTSMAEQAEAARWRGLASRFEPAPVPRPPGGWEEEHRPPVVDPTGRPHPVPVPRPPVTPGGKPHPKPRPAYGGPTAPFGPGMEPPVPQTYPGARTPEQVQAEIDRLTGLAEGIGAGTVPWTDETVFGGPRAKANNIPWSVLGFGTHAAGQAWAERFYAETGIWPWQGDSDDENENLAQNIAGQLLGGSAAGGRVPEDWELAALEEQYIPLPEEEYGFGGFGGGFFPFYGGGGGGYDYEQPLPPWFYTTQGFGV